MPRTTREWLHAMRALAPLCARHPRLFVSTMEHVARKQNGQITTVPMPPSEGGPKLPPPSAPVRQVSYATLSSIPFFHFFSSAFAPSICPTQAFGCSIRCLCSVKTNIWCIVLRGCRIPLNSTVEHQSLICFCWIN